MCRVTANSMQYEEQHSQVPREKCCDSRDERLGERKRDHLPRHVPISGEDVGT